MNFVRRYREVTIFEYDANYLFNRVIDNPAEFPETSHYRNTTMFCDAYRKQVQARPACCAQSRSDEHCSGTMKMMSFHPACGTPIDQYLWADTLHPTYPMHNFMASQIKQLLLA